MSKAEPATIPSCVMFHLLCWHRHRYCYSIDRVNEKVAGPWQSPADVTDLPINPSSFQILDPMPVPVLRTDNSFPSPCVSSSSWAGSRGSCVGAKGSSLLQREDPPQWFHCGEQKRHSINLYKTFKAYLLNFFNVVCEVYKLIVFVIFWGTCGGNIFISTHPRLDSSQHRCLSDYCNCLLNTEATSPNKCIKWFRITHQCFQ